MSDSDYVIFLVTDEERCAGRPIDCPYSVIRRDAFGDGLCWSFHRTLGEAISAARQHAADLGRDPNETVRVEVSAQAWLDLLAGLEIAVAALQQYAGGKTWRHFAADALAELERRGVTASTGQIT